MAVGGFLVMLTSSGVGWLVPACAATAFEIPMLDAVDRRSADREWPNAPHRHVIGRFDRRIQLARLAATIEATTPLGLTHLGRARERGIAASRHS